MKNLSTNILAILLMTASVCGCQSILISSRTGEASSQENVVVQIRPAAGKPKNVEVLLTPNMRLQDVVSAAKPSFRKKTAYIVRTSPKTGEKHKLEATFGSNRRVTMETDYAVQPGDRVVIVQDTTTSFDQLMRSMVGRS